ncbi:MAG: mitochondrial fission ELM1 family protein [Candidatus Omnitrophica bacterium]|nr:mitochondrial fission ELM1 family protein [Candidatus Omnitrophota bacterium]
MTEYISFILFKGLGFIIRKFPIDFSLFLGRRLGDLIFCLDLKHKALSYSNIKAALGSEYSPSEINRITRKFYQSFGQNLIEVFLIPLVDKHYINKYVSIEGLDNLSEAFKKGKGVILLPVHEGSWELSNIISANLGYPYSMFVRNQKKFKLIEGLLNSYRQKSGCKLIQRQNQTRNLIGILKNNEAVGLTMDQGGKNGVLVKFFGRNAAMASGAIRLSLKYQSVILPVFFTRVHGPHIKLFIEKPFELKVTNNRAADIRDNIQELTHIFEKYIRLYPQEYLWTYKIWKYSDQKNILILSDAKTGHLRQAQALAKIMEDAWQEKGIKANVEYSEIKFKSRMSRRIFSCASFLSGKYTCQGCLDCLKSCLENSSYKALVDKKPNVVVSCGSSLTAVNYLISRENLAKSVIIMRPAILNEGKFDLVVMPRHDNPPRSKNVVVTNGALNLINQDYLRNQSDKLLQSTRHTAHGLRATDLHIGLLIGGDAKNFKLEKNSVLEVIRQIKLASEKLGMNILATTSRRTSQEVENIFEQELKDYPRCKLLVIANKNNIPEAVGGILGLSKIVVVSAESISMISEAASSGKHVLVFEADGLGEKHRRFLEYCAMKKYIYLTKPEDLNFVVENIMVNKPQVQVIEDRSIVKEALEKIL